MRTIIRLSLVLCLLSVSVSVAADVEYRLGPATELLDAAFYAGEPGDGSDVAGRMALWGSASNDAKSVAFLAVNVSTEWSALFVVDIGDPSTWRRLTPDERLYLPPVWWSPDSQSVLEGWRKYSIVTGARSVINIHGYGIEGASSTRLPTGNWFIGRVPGGANWGKVLALPVLSNGDEDPTRQPVIVADLGQASVANHYVSVAADGSALTFTDEELSLDPEVPNQGDVYVLKNLQAIMGAPKRPGTDISSLAPTSLDDPNIVSIRTDESPNPAGMPVFSDDMSLVWWSEDWNNVISAGDYYGTVTLADFDVMISNADGSGDDIRLANPGNQGAAIPTPGGARFIYVKEVGAVLHSLISTLEVATDLSGDVVGDPADNDIITTEDQQASDTSGTVVDIGSGTMIDFPVGVTQEIQIWTPIDPATDPELPDGVDAIPVIREFGPEDTSFNPPATVTITYTHAQIAGMDEPNLRVFKYNSVSGKYDIEVTTIVDRDLANNTISFTVAGFSKYGLGAPTDTDGDGLTDDVDPDDDNDGLLDGSDPYPLDTDNDGTDNADDWDDDRDGIPDGDDPYPLDTDNDGLNNADDDDDDGDGLPDGSDAFLYDTDNDGEMNDVDDDDDNDGYSDAEEMAAGTDPLDPGAFPVAAVSLIGLVLLSFSLIVLGRRQLSVKRV